MKEMPSNTFRKRIKYDQARKIIVSSIGTLEIIKSNEKIIEIEGEKKIIDKLDIEIDEPKKMVSIEMPSIGMAAGNNIWVKFYCKELTKVVLKSIGSVKLDKSLNRSKNIIQISNVGLLLMYLDVDEIGAEIKNIGIATILGQIVSGKFELGKIGKLNIENLERGNASVTMDDRII